MLKVPANYKATVLDISNYFNPYFKHKIVLEVTPIDSTFLMNNFTINAYVPTLPNMRIADQLEIKNLKIINRTADYDSLYSHESLVPKLFTSNLSYSTIYRPGFSIIRTIKEGKYNFAQNLRNKMSKITNVLFEFIFLGLKNTNKTSDELRRKFNYWGITHYLARSGLHVVMIIFLWSLLLKLIPANYILKQFGLTLLSIGYYLLSWTSVSFERALITFLFMQCCLLLKLPFRSTYLITLCSLLFLIINPIQLFFLDFQLSFSLALGLSLFNELKK